MKRKLAALVIGNANYRSQRKLGNSVNDAEDMAKKLEDFGFEVILQTDSTYLEMNESLVEFGTLLEKNDVGMFFFAGHGLQVKGSNYLLGVDTEAANETQVKFTSLPLDAVVEEMESSEASTKIIALDACRNNPWKFSAGRDATARGLASVYAPEGTIIGFATSPGQTADDGSGRNGAYTEALLQHIGAEDYPVEMMFKRVRNTVAATTAGKQTTWEHTSLGGEFYFNLGINSIVDEYNESALADSLLELDSAKPSHEIIRGLKSYNWYVQNPALEKLDNVTVKKMGPNNLFVLGRNIYQAACGSSGEARGFIADFFKRTEEFPAKRRKALLDGMLFEIFFDPKGKLRPHIKAGYFNEVFDLQKHAIFKSSFEFIATTLQTARADYPTIPGSGHSLDVTVSSKKKKAGYLIDGVFIGGRNMLHIPEDDIDEIDGINPTSRTNCERLSDKLSEQLAVPLRLLNVTYAPAEIGEDDKLLIPRGWGILPN
ncbi:MAG: caspase family protein [Litorimonas sp.]